MNQQLKQLYVCCLDNKVLIFETNLSNFHKALILNKLIGFSKTYRQIRTIFEKNVFFEFESSGKKYTIQKLI